MADHDAPPPPTPEDPKLEIPEVLREKPAAPPPPESRRRTSFGDTARAWGLAMDLVFTSVGGFVIGLLIDRWQGTGPWGAIIGLALGFITAAVRLVRTTQRDLAKGSRGRGT